MRSLIVLCFIFWEWYSSHDTVFEDLDGESLFTDFCIISAAPVIFIAPFFRRSNKSLIVILFAAAFSVPFNLLMSVIYSQLIWKFSNWTMHVVLGSDKW